MTYRAPAVLRIALAAVVGVDLVSLAFFLRAARRDALANGITAGAFAAVVSRPSVTAAVAVIAIAAAVAFGRRAGRLWEGIVALGGLALFSTAHAQLFGSPWRHLFYSGICLTGWLLGLAVSRRRGLPSDESYARTGAIALLGAAYLNAGISKLAFGGSDWLSALPIQAVIVGQSGLVADGLVSLYRSWVVNQPAVGAAFSLATVGFELAGPLMLLGGRTRLCVAIGLFAMHANIYVLTGILYWESMLLLALFGLSPDPPASAVVVGATPAPGTGDRMFAAVATLLALCAVLAIAHQARRHAQAGDYATASELAFPAPTFTLATVPTLQRVGPFTVGQRLAQTWSVDALDLSDEGFIVTTSGAPGRARFELTCAASQKRSPFDLGGTHIFYSSDLDVRDFEAAAWEVQAQLRRAADGRDTCELVQSWRAAAEATLKRARLAP
jgi:hypothetical protein